MKPTINSVIPSNSGTPNSIATLGQFEFVSLQGSGQIFTYNISSGSQVLVGTPYKTPCSDPSGMVIANIGGTDVMAVVCFDTASLLTLTVHGDGSLSALGSVSGLDTPYPGIVLDGTNVLVPLYGKSLLANGGVAKVNIASPAKPVVTAIATLASPVSGGFANPGYLTAAGGYIYLMAGSESGPLEASSTIQVVNEETMEVVGKPLVVAHSPQQVAVKGNVLYVTLYDAAQVESIDISDPTNLKPLQVFSLVAPQSACHALSVTVQNDSAYIGCYAEGKVEEFDLNNPSDLRLVQSISGVVAPQRLLYAGNYLLVTGAVAGGNVYQVNMGQF